MDGLVENRDTDRGEAASRGRRLSDKLLVAFHHACDAKDLEVAQRLLKTLEGLIERNESRSLPNRRKTVEGLVAAHERLWHLRHGETESAG